VLTALHSGGEVPAEAAFATDAWGVLASRSGWKKP